MMFFPLFWDKVAHPRGPSCELPWPRVTEIWFEVIGRLGTLSLQIVLACSCVQLIPVVKEKSIHQIPKRYFPGTSLLMLTQLGTGSVLLELVLATETLEQYVGTFTTRV